MNRAPASTRPAPFKPRRKDVDYGNMNYSVIRRVLFSLLTALLASGCGGGEGNPSGSIDDGVGDDAKVDTVYLSVVLHYEESFVQAEDYFVRQRNDLLAPARYLRDENIRLNVGPDWAFMTAFDSFETEEMRQETGGKSVLPYLKEDLGHEIDPHAHEHGWNYADVAFS